MASSKKRTRSLTQDEEEEETHAKEEIDLNKEPEAEAKVDEDANQDDGNREIMRTRRRLTPEEEKERAEQDDAAILSMFLGNVTQAENQANMAFERERKTKSKDKDDSEQTLRLLRRWDIPEIPPEKVVNRYLIEQCSRPIRKQLTESDVRGKTKSRLALSKSQVRKKFMNLLQESEIPRGKEGLKVSVYGPDGKVHEMKMWAQNWPDLTTGWRNFVDDYGLKEVCDFIAVWMFRHRQSQQICLAIDAKRFSFRKRLSQRISDAVFENSD